MTIGADNFITEIRTAFATAFDTADEAMPHREYLPHFIAALDKCASANVGQTTVIPPSRPTALATAINHSAAAKTTIAKTPVATALSPYIDNLDWYQIFESGDIDQGLATGLLAGQLIGKRGIVKADDVFVGLFLLAPGVCYPFHQHAALEIYHVLSGSIDITHGRTKAPMHIKAGQSSVTPPHQVHQLQTGDEACLIAYVWTGDMTGGNWWWEKQPDQSWDRICWDRQPDSSWAISKREPLSDAEIIRSGDG
ncbi:dimethylsulfonioproprionate lyase family protein [Alphaproteobacteria bacterium]|nr:dimethylsulfonioproprionate lyase family protein [Alphaproteobacteria bacterium]